MDNLLNLTIIVIILSCDLFLTFGKPTGPDVAWFHQGREAVSRLARQKPNHNPAKNVVLFVGDGMGLSTIMASRVYKGQSQGRTGEEETLSFEKFPNVALSKTYTVDYQVPDSAATATAILSGVKTNLGTVGVESFAKKDCSNLEENKAYSIVKWSQLAGKRTGVVTNMRITDGTPAASYANSPSRYWESSVDKADTRCHDIAYQLIHGETGPDINVILGGGRRSFLPKGTSDPVNTKLKSRRKDDRDLLQDWKLSKSGHTSSLVYNRSQLLNVDTDNTEHLLGLFASSHMAHPLDRDSKKEPSLAEMAETALKILQKDEQGFFLLVEAGWIDNSHHSGQPKRALVDTIELDKAVEKVLEMTNEDDTLVVVTADHSHVFTVGGYPTRGNPILGLVDDHWYKPMDDIPFTTLGYTNGPGGAQILGPRLRPNHTHEQTMSDDYVPPALVPLSAETHGGEDVAIYANGPMSHLFKGVLEQNYIAHAMAYASCVGEYRRCEWFDGMITTNASTRGWNGDVWTFNLVVLLVLCVVKF